MVDFILIVAPMEPFIFNSFEPFEWKGLQFVPKYKHGILKGFETEYKGLRVALYDNEIKISNSLHKFYKGNNYSDFRHSELMKAIDSICQKFEIEAKYWEIKKLEFGFNIRMPQPASSYLNLFGEYKKKKFDKMRDKHIDYGRKCFMSEYSIKVYDKHLQVKWKDKQNDVPNTLLRVEICYNQHRKLPKRIKTLQDLQDKEKFKDLYSSFSEAIDNIVFYDATDFSNSTNEERLLFHASLNPNFIKVEEEINKVQAKATKIKIKQLKERFLKKGFKKLLQKSLKDKYIELYSS